MSVGIRPKDLKNGSKHMTTQCGYITVLRYENAKSVTIRFDNTGHVKTVKACVIRTGNIQDPLARTLCGIGFFGIGEMTQTNCKDAGNSWRSMISRCYSESYLRVKPTYRVCSVADDWHNFQNFARWYKENYPKDSGEYHLDKDLLIVGNKIYSPESCIFIPQWLNSFMSGAMAIRGDWPIGVSFSKSHRKFESYCNYMGKRKHLGLHATPESAHLAWKMCKLEIAEKRKSEMDIIDVRIYPNVVKIIELAK